MAAAIASQRSSDEGNKSERTRKQPDQDHRPTGWLRAFGVAVVAAAFTIAVFSPAMPGGFVWDDAGLITKRHDTLDEWSDVMDAFKRAATAGEGVAYYRPIMIATFVADAKLFGFEAPVFHRTNVVLHGLNVGLIVLTLVAYGCELWAAGIAALLFGLHPLQSQAVALILGRNDLLLVLPVAAMLLADEIVRRRGRPWLADVLVTLCFAATLWTKETGIVAPLFLVLLDVLWRGKPLTALRARVPLFVALTVVTVLYFATRLAVIGALIDNGRYGYIPLLERPAVAAAILGHYVRHLVLPWGFAPAPYHSGLVDPARPDLWVAAAFVALYLAGTAVALRYNRRLAAGLLIFGAALVPVLALGAPMKVLILEHRTYLPLLGLAFGVAAVRPIVDTTAGRAVAAAILAVLAVITYRRLPSYSEALPLWQMAVEAAPESDYARNNYGAALMDAEQWDAAVVQLREAVRLNPAYAMARFNLAETLAYLGNTAEAIQHYSALVEQRPDDTAMMQKLALLKSRTGDLAGARALWERAVAVRPNDANLVRNLADATDRLDSAAAALPFRRRVAELEPDKAASWAGVGRALLAAGQPTDAAAAYQRALDLGPESGVVHAALGQALFQSGRWKEAATHAARARELGVVDKLLLEHLSAVGVDVEAAD
jgi:tetratricopeptide (TPR) repeat protein